MTKDEILKMEPGQELNIKVAEKVMGNTVVNDEILGYVERPISTEPEEEKPSCCGTCGGSTEGAPGWGLVEPYSEDPSAAMLVVNRMLEKGYHDATNWNNFGGGKYTEAEAICKAALIAMLDKESLIEASDKILREVLDNEEGKNTK